MNRNNEGERFGEIGAAGSAKAHPEIEALERYALGRLDEPELGQLEEHLLICAPCQERLDEAAEYVSVMREATALAAATEKAEPAWRRWIRMDWLPVPAPALAGAMAVLLAALIWHPWAAEMPTEWRTVELQTLRGGTAAAETGLEGYSLHLRLDVAGLDMNGTTAQIVDAGGAVLAELPIVLADGKAELRYAPGLAAGDYWVRLKWGGETVREYALRVQKRA